MKDAKLGELMAALPDKAALQGIRAYILHEGLKGDLAAAAKVFDELWQCAGHEEVKAELTEFLVARYAYRRDLVTARKFYARFASLADTGATLQAQAAAVHILAYMVMEVNLEKAIQLWREYVQLPIPAQFKRVSAPTGLAALRRALKNSDVRNADQVFFVLHALAQETGDENVAIRAKEILEKEAL
ncbi:MAG: hypothetical protein K2G99_07885 [Desulfovibrio sp.]|nr:hypothetical protein [Desulfovibrio sp.]